MAMDPRALTPDYHVSPQIDPADAPAIKAAGYDLVICNRPDAEVPPSHQSDAMRAAIEAAGLRFVVLPLTHQTMPPTHVPRWAKVVSPETKALAAPSHHVQIRRASLLVEIELQRCRRKPVTNVDIRQSIHRLRL
jgi:protein tyrosine phosphatase (PTP) superfamily phosphohydrolase (DUF442 family)